jgi:hypothetical protein
MITCAKTWLGDRKNLHFAENSEVFMGQEAGAHIAIQKPIAREYQSPTA